MFEIGDRVIIKADYSFDGEIGIIREFDDGLFGLEVPAYKIDPTNAGHWWHVFAWEVEPVGFWSDKLEAEKDLEKLLTKYRAA